MHAEQQADSGPGVGEPTWEPCSSVCGIAVSKPVHVVPEEEVLALGALGGAMLAAPGSVNAAENIVKSWASCLSSLLTQSARQQTGAVLGRDSYEIGYISHKSLKMKRETIHIPMTIHSPDPGHDHRPKTLRISVYRISWSGPEEL